MKHYTRFILVAALALTPLLHADEVKEKRRTVVVKDGKVFKFDGGIPPSITIMSRGYLGIQMLPLTPELRIHFHVPKDAGVLISRVPADGPAAKAGLRAGDVVTAVDGARVDSAGDVARAVRDRKSGDTIRIDYTRDGVPATATAALQEQARKEVDLRDLDIQIPEVGKHLEEYFNSAEWKAKMEQLQQLPDCGAMQQRMRELESKMKDLERRLQQK